MNLLKSELRGTGRRVWTEHDDELAEMIMDLFGDAIDTPRQERSPSVRTGEHRTGEHRTGEHRSDPVLLD